MLFGKKLAVVLTAVFAAAMIATITMSPVAGAVRDAAVRDAGQVDQKAADAYKLAHDTDPHIPLPASEQAKLEEKDRALARSISKNGGIGAATVVARAAAAYPTTSGILMNQIPQQRSYWCGPATVQEALQQLGVSVGQARLASELGTTSSGTAWSGGPTRTGRPIPDILNKYQSRNYYIAIDVPVGYGGALDSYKRRLMIDIAGIRAPLVGDAYQVPNGYHLLGHPPNHQIFHWFDIRGYAQSGTKTMYEDTVAGSPTIGWSANVPPYSTIDSWKILTIMSGRGYIW